MQPPAQPELPPIVAYGPVQAWVVFSFAATLVTGVVMSMLLVTLLYP